MTRVSGKEIIQAVVEDMYEGREELRYSVLPPGVYRIYLHEIDYKRFVPIVKHLVDEMSQALDEEIDQMNGQPGGSDQGLLAILKGSFTSIKQKAQSIIQGDFRKRVWKKPAEGWQIAINIDPNEELEPGDLCVNSELMLPAPIELGKGNPTRNLTTIRRKGTTLRSERKYAPVSPAASNFTSVLHEQPDAARKAENAYALIRYSDQGKEKIFEITKNIVVVGRGGSDLDVDLVFHENTRISREHFVVRRDESSGKFYIKDISKFGTKVDGVLLAQSHATGAIETTGSGYETELPPSATIELGGSLKIEFQALK